MVMGGAGSGGTPRAQSPAVKGADSRSPAPESEKANVEAGGHAERETAKEVLRTEEFWADLKGFLAQRLRDEGEGEKLGLMFKEAWEKRS